MYIRQKEEEKLLYGETELLLLLRLLFFGCRVSNYFSAHKFICAVDNWAEAEKEDNEKEEEMKFFFIRNGMEQIIEI